MTRSGLVWLLALTLAACGGDENAKTPDGSGKTKGAGQATDGGTSPGESKPAAQPDDKPAKRPPLTKAEFTKLSARTLGGFTGSVSHVSDRRLSMVFVTEETAPGGNKLAVQAMIQPCDISACFSMDPSNKMNEQWAKQGMASLEKQGYESPVFEVGRFELAPGYVGLMHYQRGHKVEVREGGLKSKSSSHGFNVRYHDGSHAIALRVFAQGSVGAESVADLEQAMPRAMAEDAARKVFGLYADLFEKGGS